MRTKTAAAIAFTMIDRYPDREETAMERIRHGVASGRREEPGSEEDLIIRAGGLAEARKMRDAILVVAALLGELDDLMPDEPDRTAFDEIANLLQDVSEFASFGAEAARRAAGEVGH